MKKESILKSIDYYIQVRNYIVSCPSDNYNMTRALLDLVVEKLHNLESLPSTGFTVSCFPVKVRGGSAGWTRAVAIIDA